MMEGESNGEHGGEASVSDINCYLIDAAMVKFLDIQYG